MKKADVADMTALFYRHTLGAEEVKAWRRAIKSTWGAGEHYWFPFAECTHPSLIALDRFGINEGDLQRDIRQFLLELGDERVIELREHGASYERETAEVELLYAGGEVFWTATGNDWIVYCSHEQTMTLGGAIAPVIGQPRIAWRHDPTQPPHWLASRH